MGLRVYVHNKKSIAEMNAQLQLLMQMIQEMTARQRKMQADMKAGQEKMMKMELKIGQEEIKGRDNHGYTGSIINWNRGD